MSSLAKFNLLSVVELAGYNSLKRDCFGVEGFHTTTYIKLARKDDVKVHRNQSKESLVPF